MNISFTTTATNRPEILDRTYSSFKNNLLGIDMKKCDLVINVDPLPMANNREAVLEVARRYFGNVIATYPDKANFTTAINTIWSYPKTSFIFHLEDDWILTQSIKVNNIMDHLDNHPQLVQCVLRAYKYDYDKMALSPSIIKKKLYSQIAGKLDPKLNPEIQLRNTAITKYKLNKNTIAVHGESPVVEDIGREWIDKSGFRRPDKKAHFNSWVKNDS